MVWLLRVTVTLHAVCVVAQPVLAGLYLDGDYDALSAHSLNGSLLPASAMLVGAAALGYLLAGGTGWPLLTTDALFLAEGVQIGMGHSRVLVVHLPLGVGITVLHLAFVWWAWRRAGRPRRSLRLRPGLRADRRAVLSEGSAR